MHFVFLCILYVDGMVFFHLLCILYVWMECLFPAGMQGLRGGGGPEVNPAEHELQLRQEAGVGDALRDLAWPGQMEKAFVGGRAGGRSTTN